MVQCHNPWAHNYIAGGSSGGSAAAVASGMCYATVDTDAVGSCRLPASCCGVVGFVGTHGLVDNSGILDGEATDPAILKLASTGITARSAEDVAVMLSILTGEDIGVGDGSLKVAVADNAAVHPSLGLAFKKATKVLSKKYDLLRADGPFDSPGFDISRIDQDREAIKETLFSKVDLLILPTTVQPVPTIEDVEGNPQALSPQNTLFANYYGLPAVSVPCGFDENGVPIGLQIVGAPERDAQVLQLAKDYAKLARWEFALSAK